MLTSLEEAKHHRCPHIQEFELQIALPHGQVTCGVVCILHEEQHEISMDECCITYLNLDGGMVRRADFIPIISGWGVYSNPVVF